MILHTQNIGIGFLTFTRFPSERCSPCWRSPSFCILRRIEEIEEIASSLQSSCAPPCCRQCPAPGTRHTRSGSRQSEQSPQCWGPLVQWRWSHSSSQPRGSQSPGKGSRESLLTSSFHINLLSPCKSSYDAKSYCHWNSWWCLKDRQAKPITFVSRFFK